MASQPFDVPKSFVEQLQSYDEYLRVRWDHRDACWRIERKAKPGTLIAPRASFSPADWDARGEGYFCVMRVPQNCLDRRVLWNLGISDIHRHGANRLAGRMEADEIAAIRRQRAAFHDEIEYKSKERWTSWNSNYPLRNG